MRPATVHALAQFLRHSRGCLTTVEKWVAETPPDVLAEECAAVIFLVRGVLMDLNTTLGEPRSPTAPRPASAVTTDRPAAQAARVAAVRE